MIAVCHESTFLPSPCLGQHWRAGAYTHSFTCYRCTFKCVASDVEQATFLISAWQRCCITAFCRQGVLNGILGPVRGCPWYFVSAVGGGTCRVSLYFARRRVAVTTAVSILGWAGPGHPTQQFRLRPCQLAYLLRRMWSLLLVMYDGGDISLVYGGDISFGEWGIKAVRCIGMGGSLVSACESDDHKFKVRVMSSLSQRRFAFFLPDLPEPDTFATQSFHPNCRTVRPVPNAPARVCPMSPNPTPRRPRYCVSHTCTTHKSMPAAKPCIRTRPQNPSMNVLAAALGFCCCRGGCVEACDMGSCGMPGNGCKSGSACGWGWLPLTGLMDPPAPAAGAAAVPSPAPRSCCAAASLAVAPATAPEACA